MSALLSIFFLIALILDGSYADLSIWAVLSIIFGVICAITTKKQS